jgi:hypothetical protein
MSDDTFAKRWNEIMAKKHEEERIAKEFMENAHIIYDEPSKWEICGNFPTGYAMCDILEKEGKWLKFRAPSGREGWAVQALGHYCEREKR